MNWTLQMFKQIAAGISGFFGLIGDVADVLAPFAPYLMALSGAGIVVLVSLKLFTEWGQNLYASIIFVVSIFLASIGLQFMDGKEAEQKLASYLPEMNDTTKSIINKVQGFADELQKEYDKIDSQMKNGGALTKHQALTVQAKAGNVRSEPSTKAEIKFRLPQGSKVTLLETRGAWYRVRADDGQTGWAHRMIFKAANPTP